jgi:hypothetical protein
MRTLTIFLLILAGCTKTVIPPKTPKTAIPVPNAVDPNAAVDPKDRLTQMRIQLEKDRAWVVT